MMAPPMMMSSFQGILFSPDSKLMLTGTQDGALTLWDVDLGRELRPLQLPEQSPIRNIVFSPDGASLVLEFMDERLGLWEVATGKKRLHYGREPKLAAMQPRMTARIQGGMMVMAAPGKGGFGGGFANGLSETVVFSPDGKLLAQGRSDNAVGIWETATGKLLGEFKGHQGPIDSLAFAPDGKTLASGSSDTTALIWDLTELKKRLKPAMMERSEQELEAAWTDLAGEDAVKAFDAITKLASAPASAVPMLKKQLPPTAPVDAAQVEKLIGELDSQRFAARKKASTELEKIGELAVPFYEKALANQPSPETRKRIEELVAKVQRQALTGDRLRQLRAIEALSHMASPEARQLLAELAKGAPGALPTRAAEQALKHLGQP
jgi:hypothetical protein